MKNKLMIGALALSLLGASSAAFAEDGDQYLQNIYSNYNANAVTAQQAVRNAQASVGAVSRQGVKSFTAAEKQWFDDATPATAN